MKWYEKHYFVLHTHSNTLATSSWYYLILIILICFAGADSTCAVCHKAITLTKDGSVRVHGPSDNHCPGSGKPPAEGAATPPSTPLHQPAAQQQTGMVPGELRKTMNPKTPGECCVIQGLVYRESKANGVLYLESVSLVHAFRAQSNPRRVEP